MGYISVYMLSMFGRKGFPNNLFTKETHIYMLSMFGCKRSPTNFSAKERYLLSLFDGRKGFRNNPMIKPREKKPWMHGFSKQAQTSLDAWFFKASKSSKKDISRVVVGCKSSPNKPINKDIYIYLSAKRKIFNFVDRWTQGFPKQSTKHAAKKKEKTKK